MTEHPSSISVAQRLHQHAIFYFTPPSWPTSSAYALTRPTASSPAPRPKSSSPRSRKESSPFWAWSRSGCSPPLFIACHLVAPAYVSYWSDLYFYGFTKQAPLTIFVATTKKKRPMTFPDLRFCFVNVKSRKFFGYRREIVGDLRVVIAGEAKAIVDSLDQPRYTGGIGEVASALRAEVEVEALVEYANRMGDESLSSRLRHLPKPLGHPVEGLIRSASQAKLDPSRPRTGSHESRWRVMVNLPQSSTNYTS